VTLYVEAVDEHHHGQPKLKLLETSRYRVTTQDGSDGRPDFRSVWRGMTFCVRGSNRDEIFLAGIVTRCLCRGLLSRGVHDESK
jgi:hypothetical protein